MMSDALFSVGTQGSERGGPTWEQDIHFSPYLITKHW